MYSRLSYLPVVALCGLISLLSLRLEPDLGLPVLYSLRGERTPSANAFVVAIDQPSVEWLAFHAPQLKLASPFLHSCLPTSAREALEAAQNVEDLPRSIYGCLLRALVDHNPAVVVLDTHFSGAGAPDDDAMLRRGLLNLPQTVLLARLEMLESSGNFILRRPSDAIADGMPTGFFTTELRSGDTYRYLARVEDFPDAVSLADKALSLSSTSKTTAFTVLEGSGIYRNLNLYGPAGTVPFLTLQQVFEDPLALAVTTSRAVFVGSSQPGGTEVRDSFETAFSTAENGDLGGVEIVATAYLNLQEGTALRRLSHPLEIVVSFLVGLLILVASARQGGIVGVLIAASIVAVWLFFAFVVFDYLGFWVPIVGPVFGIGPIAGVLALLGGYLRAENLIGRLLPVPLREAAMRGATSSGESVSSEEATVIFVDVVGSTTLAVDLPPAAFATLMGDCMSLLTEEVEHCRGAVVKYTGDGLIAVFSAAHSGTRHAALAIEAVRRSEKQLFEKNSILSLAGLPYIALRIGIDSGHVVLGVVGSKRRGSVDILGDPVNVSARLEQLGKELPSDNNYVTVLISERTALHAGDEVGPLDSLGPHHLKGLRKPLDVFRLRSALI